MRGLAKVLELKTLPAARLSLRPRQPAGGTNVNTRHCPLISPAAPAACARREDLLQAKHLDRVGGVCLHRQRAAGACSAGGQHALVGRTGGGGGLNRSCWAACRRCSPRTPVARRSVPCCPPHPPDRCSSKSFMRSSSASTSGSRSMPWSSAAARDSGGCRVRSPLAERKHAGRWPGCGEERAGRGAAGSRSGIWRLALQHAGAPRAPATHHHHTTQPHTATHTKLT